MTDPTAWLAQGAALSAAARVEALHLDLQNRVDMDPQRHSAYVNRATLREYLVAASDARTRVDRLTAFAQAVVARHVPDPESEWPVLCAWCLTDWPCADARDAAEHLTDGGGSDD